MCAPEGWTRELSQNAGVEALGCRVCPGHEQADGGMHCAQNRRWAACKQGCMGAIFGTQNPLVTGRQQVAGMGTKGSRQLDGWTARDRFASGG